MKRRLRWPPNGRHCAACGILMPSRPLRVLTCSQVCTFIWLRDTLRLVPHSKTGEPFIFGLTNEEAYELCLLDEIVDTDRLRALQHKHSEAIASDKPEVEAFVERSTLTTDEVH